LLQQGRYPRFPGRLTDDLADDAGLDHIDAPFPEFIFSDKGGRLIQPFGEISLRLVSIDPRLHKRFQETFTNPCSAIARTSRLALLPPTLNDCHSTAVYQQKGKLPAVILCR